MKLTPSKKSLGEFFLSYGWVSLLVVFVCFVAFSYSINAVDEIKDYEKIDYFFETYSLVEDNDLSEKTLAYLKDDGIIQSNVYSVSPNDSDKNTKFSRFGAYSDIVLLKGTDLDDLKEVIADNFLPITDLKERLKEGCSASYSFYSAYGNDYAFKLYDPSDSAYSAQFDYSSLLSFSKEGEEDDSYYLLIPTLSVNYGGSTEIGFKAFSHFLSLYEVK